MARRWIRLQLPNVVVLMRPAHLALLFASGRFNGVVRPVNEPPHLLRVSCRKVPHLLSEFQSGSETIRRVTERIQVDVVTLNQEGDLWRGTG